jgi:hypothetical protein
MFLILGIMQRFHISTRALLYMHYSVDVKENTLLGAMDSHGGRPKSPFCVSETLVFFSIAFSR